MIDIKHDDWAVITTLNEEASIYQLVGELRGLGLGVIVVDAQSDDDTVSLAYEAGAYVHPVGRWPIGPALQAGWRKALAFDAKRIVQLDAGGSHDPQQALQLLAALDGADMAIGSRFMKGSIYLRGLGSRGRPMISRGISALCNLTQTGPNFSDWSSGFRAFRPYTVRVLDQHTYMGSMHGWQLEVLAHAVVDNFKIKEVPITYILGESSLNLRVAYEASQVWLHILHHLQGSKELKGNKIA